LIGATITPPRLQKQAGARSELLREQFLTELRARTGGSGRR